MSETDLDSPSGSTPQFDGAQDALNRMRRASERGTGCHLTAEMIQSLACTLIAELWHGIDPRTEPRGNQ